MESLKVRDIMQVEVVTIGPEASVRELSVLLGEKGVSGVPVVDGQGKVVGVVSEGDVILQDAELHFPHYVQFLDSVIFLELSLIHISEPTRLRRISYAVFCL